MIIEIYLIRISEIIWFSIFSIIIQLNLLSFITTMAALALPLLAFPVPTTICPNCLIAQPTDMSHWGIDWSKGLTGTLDLTQCTSCKIKQTQQCVECKRSFLMYSDMWHENDDSGNCVECWGKSCPDCGLWESHAVWASTPVQHQCIKLHETPVNQPKLLLPTA